MSGLFSSFFWEQGFNKVCESSRTLELFEGFDVQCWKTGPWAPPPTFKSSQLVVYIYSCRGKKGLEWDYVIIVEQKKESFKVQCKCRVVQILGSSECVTSLALGPRKLPGLILITDHIS